MKTFKITTKNTTVTVQALSIILACAVFKARNRKEIILAVELII